MPAVARAALASLSDALSPSPSERFPRASRLLSPADFKRVFSRACKVSGRNFVVLARPNALGRPRLGLAVSKKHAKTAVSRNRLKRQVRESFRLKQMELGGIDVIFLSRPGADGVAPRDLRQDLERLWPRLIERCEQF